MQSPLTSVVLVASVLECCGGEPKLGCGRTNEEARNVPGGKERKKDWKEAESLV